MTDLPEEEAIKALGNRIRELRKLKNLSMQKLADIADVELSVISRLETGKVNPKLSTVFIIAKALETRLSELFNYDI